jgi:long-subunit fatty acid transport protein
MSTSRWTVRRCLGALALATPLAAAPTAATAGGLLIPGTGPIATGRAGAYVANARDPSAVAVNPAGLATHEGTVVLVGSSFLDYDVEFTRTGTYEASGLALPWEGDPYPTVRDDSRPDIGIGPYQALPALAVSTDLGLAKAVPGLRFGLGIVAPTAFPTRSVAADYVLDDPAVPPPPSRYDIVEQNAAVITPTVAVAYRVHDKLDVGARFGWGFADVRAKTYVWVSRNYEEHTGNESEFVVDATDGFVPQVGFGLLARPHADVELGLDWVSEMRVNAVGTGESETNFELNPGEPLVIEPPDDALAQCAPGGEIGALKSCINIGLPMVTTVGARYVLRDGAGQPRGDVELDVAWERWSSVSDHYVVVDGVSSGLPLSPQYIRHGFDDAVSVRLGGGYAIGVGKADLGLRGGVAYDTAAARPGWERMDLDGAARTTLALGASYLLPKVEVHLGGGYVHEGERTVGDGCNTTNDQRGCGAGGAEIPVNDREGADPAQPTNSGDPFQSPFNHGTYKSGYVMFSLAVVAKF